MYLAAEVLQLMRVRQYGKQIFVFLPCITLGQEISTHDLLNSFLAIFSFSLLASTIYILNDKYDVDQDKLHPYKSNRPLAKDTIKVKQATFIGLTTLLASLAITFCISSPPIPLYTLTATYVLINIIYSKFRLKQNGLLGIIFVASGFPIRFTFGTLAIGAQFSYWAFSLSFVLAIFLLTGKRIQQQQSLPDEATNNAVEQGKLFLFGGLLVAEYIAFTLQEETQLAWGESLLFITPLLVALFVAKYLEIVLETEKKQLADVTETFYKDSFVFAICCLYIILMFTAKVQA